MAKTLLEQLEEHINVDVDSFDIAFMRSMPIKFHDQTSNQQLAHEALTAHENTSIVTSTIQDMKGSPWDEIYVTALARIAATIAPVISGICLTQTSPSHAYDKEYILFDARRLYQAYLAAGIPANRIAIKIAMTSAGAQAAKLLSEEGIKTLGTMLFSVPQAIAASQAGMYAISNYYNEPKAGTDLGVWPDVADPISEHPMSERHLLMRRAFNILKERTGKDQPQMKTAAFSSPREAMGSVVLGADHVTMRQALLEDLAYSGQLPVYRKGQWKVPVSQQVFKPGFAWEDWQPPLPNETAERIAELVRRIGEDKLHSLDEDYLADGVLDRYNCDDEMTRPRLEEALKRFSHWEAESRKYIEKLQAKLV